MTGLEAFAIGALVTGTGVEVAGQIAAGEAQADAARRNAQNAGMQADELLARQEINARLLREQGQEAASRFMASFASTGVEGMGIGGAIQIKKNVEDSIALSEREAEFKAKMLRAGAQIDLDLASDLQTASVLTGAGTVLSSAATAYGLYRGPSNPRKVIT